jgi:hypothetical protein
VLLALGDALMGQQLTRSLSLPREQAREMAEKMLADSLERVGWKDSAQG